MACQNSPGRGLLPLAHDGLGPGVPVPEQDGAVLRAACDVAVAGDVALGPAEAGDDAVVTEDDLHDLGALRRENPGEVQGLVCYEFWMGAKCTANTGL